MAESSESALVDGQGGYVGPRRVGEDAAADERIGLHAGSCAAGAAFSYRAAGRQGYFGFAAGDSAQGSGRGVERSGCERALAGEAFDGEGSGYSVADVAIAVVGAS